MKQYVKDGMRHGPAREPCVVVLRQPCGAKIALCPLSRKSEARLRTVAIGTLIEPADDVLLVGFVAGIARRDYRHLTVGERIAFADVDP